jgi:hypothetical protein
LVAALVPPLARLGHRDQQLAATPLGRHLAEKII